MSNFRLIHGTRENYAGREGLQQLTLCWCDGYEPCVLSPRKLTDSGTAAVVGSPSSSAGIDLVKGDAVCCEVEKHCYGTEHTRWCRLDNPLFREEMQKDGRSSLRVTTCIDILLNAKENEVTRTTTKAGTKAILSSAQPRKVRHAQRQRQQCAHCNVRRGALFVGS